MRCSTLPLVGLIAASSVSAGVVSVPFTRRHTADDVTHPSLVRRDGTLNLEAINNITGGGYYAEIGVGTPPQKLSFHLDTGSSDTWVNSVNANVCNSRSISFMGGFCQTPFNPNKSSTYTLVSRRGFDITYLDGRNIQGDYFNDTLSIAGATIKNQQLGLALTSRRSTGLMGLGFSESVSSRKKYPTVIDNMVSQGLIRARAFSLYLNDLDASAGTVLFGGVDTAKFTDGLATLPLVPLPLTKTQEIVSYNVHLKGFSVSGVSTPSINASAILDSGSTISLLPDKIAQEVWSNFGVKAIRGFSVPFVDCARASRAKDVTFSFQFDGKTIKVPMDEMVINSFADIQEKIFEEPQLRTFFQGWESVCMFGLGSTAKVGISNEKFALLGDTFLRSAYVVYDMANKQIGIAQAKLNTTATEIIEFQAGSKTIPGPVAQDNAGVSFTPPSRKAVVGSLLTAMLTIMTAL